MTVYPTAASPGPRGAEHELVLDPTRHRLQLAVPLYRKNACMEAAADELSKDARDAASETISQLAAKILNQLSLSAWLPSAALVLLVAFILELGAQQAAGQDADAVLTHASHAIADAGLGGVVLLTMVIVVATMVTQAFSFEAIRLLEGYWGPGPRIDKFAAKRCERHSNRRTALETMYREMLDKAWSDVESALADERPRFTRPMVRKLQERVTGLAAVGALKGHQRDRVRQFDWEAHVDGNVLRQVRILELRLADYPRDASRVMPTRLGNVLRRYEVETGEDDIERLVERVYRFLPFSMQLAHDEQRARLDVYCSMVFVLWFCALAAAARFGWWAWPYTLTIVAMALVSSCVAYRAAVSSARYYGALLIGIAEWVSEADAA